MIESLITICKVLRGALPASVREALPIFFVLLVFVAAAFSSSGAPSTDAKNSAAGAAKIDFNRDIRPILTENCYKCHGPDGNERKARLRFDIRGEALKPAKSGERAIVPGAPDKSQLVARITATNPDDRMPPLESGKMLTQRQIDLLRRWVAQGAPYATHWA